MIGALPLLLSALWEPTRCWCRRRGCRRTPATQGWSWCMSIAPGPPTTPATSRGASSSPVASIVIDRDGSRPSCHRSPSSTRSSSRSGSATTRGHHHRRPLSAARLFFTLDYLGHSSRAALLDGGTQLWVAGAGRSSHNRHRRGTRRSPGPAARTRRECDMGEGTWGPQGWSSSTHGQEPTSLPGISPAPAASSGN